MLECIVLGSKCVSVSLGLSPEFLEVGILLSLPLVPAHRIGVCSEWVSYTSTTVPMETT